MIQSAITEYHQRTALICGASGQDGAYLAQLLLKKGYKVFGTSRDAEGSLFSNLIKLEIKANIQLLSMVPEDFSSVLTAMRKSSPDEIYYLAGQSSLSFLLKQFKALLLGC